ncbi:restriction endonuclease subunit S [Arenibacter certesii]|uniref:Type I restriction-modification protein subunit S n=1 Tax=Arenibacter certesii TaxID=228955 RepID=A0A918J547_9FLAO|nr:restriction endonuclease subunit S [Arenibacter certesii]GGW48749.1 type I restriction-modification protein subunit S [Arenibacter certesii]
MAAQNKPSLRGGTTKQTAETKRNVEPGKKQAVQKETSLRGQDARRNDAATSSKQTVQSKRNAKSKEPRIPALRFKEFEGEWEKVKFGKLAEFKNGLNFGKEQEGTGLKVIGVGDFKNHMSISYDSLSKVNIPESHKEAFLLKDNDLLFVRSNGNKDLIGRALFLNKVKEEIGYSGFTIRARFNQGLEIHPYFYAIFFKSAAPKKQFLLLGGGTNISNLNQQILSGLEIPKPSLPEQQKIASFLSAVDKKIQQLTKKKELLEDYKKGVMQQLFTGKLRFKDEYGNEFPDWEEKRLGEVMQLPEKVKPTNFNVDKLLTVKLHTKGLFKNNNTESLKLGATNYFVRRKGQFIYGKQNLFNGAFGIIPDEFDGFYSSGDIPSIDFIPKKVVPNFVLFYLSRKNYYSRLENIASGSGSKRIHEKTFLEIKVKFPSLEEQQKIANYLSAIDTKIEAVNQQIEKTQEFKKGLLQRMFV